tara:strand:- start:133 stop:498 length:366 start_codon:yes stop_codon:yes gene_type:complete
MKNLIHKFYILLLFLIISCSSPVKIIKIVDKYPDRTDRVYQNNLMIHFSMKDIQDEYTTIATIRLNNNEIYGNLNYDTRMKNYLLNRINRVGADALIYNEELSDKEYTYFDAIHYNKQRLN